MLCLLLRARIKKKKRILALGKDLDTYRIGKHSNPQNRQKYIKNTKIRFSYFRCIFAYFARGSVFLVCGGPSFLQFALERLNVRCLLREDLEPEVLQSGFGVTFSAQFSALFFPGLQAPQKIHTQNSRPELSAFLSNFTFSNPKLFHADFLLMRPKDLPLLIEIIMLTLAVPRNRPCRVARLSL